MTARWYLSGEVAQQPLLEVSDRWGFTSLPPGQYVVSIHYNDSVIRWQQVDVRPGEVVDLWSSFRGPLYAPHES